MHRANNSLHGSSNLASHQFSTRRFKTSNQYEMSFDILKSIGDDNLGVEVEGALDSVLSNAVSSMLRVLYVAFNNMLLNYMFYENRKIFN